MDPCTGLVRHSSNQRAARPYIDINTITYNNADCFLVSDTHEGTSSQVIIDKEHRGAMPSEERTRRLLGILERENAKTVREDGKR